MLHVTTPILLSGCYNHDPELTKRFSEGHRLSITLQVVPDCRKERQEKDAESLRLLRKVDFCTERLLFFLKKAHLTLSNRSLLISKLIFRVFCKVSFSMPALLFEEEKKNKHLNSEHGEHCRCLEKMRIVFLAWFC
jgi:hypothetical protein